MGWKTHGPTQGSSGEWMEVLWGERFVSVNAKNVAGPKKLPVHAVERHHQWTSRDNSETHAPQPSDPQPFASLTNWKHHRRRGSGESIWWIANRSLLYPLQQVISPSLLQARAGFNPYKDFNPQSAVGFRNLLFKKKNYKEMMWLRTRALNTYLTLFWFVLMTGWLSPAILLNIKLTWTSAVHWMHFRLRRPRDCTSLLCQDFTSMLQNKSIKQKKWALNQKHWIWRLTLTWLASRQDKLLYTLALLKLNIVRRKVLIFANTINNGFRVRLFLESFGIRSALVHSEQPMNSRHHMLQVKLPIDYPLPSQILAQGTLDIADLPALAGHCYFTICQEVTVLSQMWIPHIRM